MKNLKSGCSWADLRAGWSATALGGAGWLRCVDVAGYRDAFGVFGRRVWSYMWREVSS